MMLEAVSITGAFIFGLLVRQVGLPPLVGFLAAGFFLNAFGGSLGMPVETGAVLKHVAHLGVLLLLFTVGLKLKLKSLIQPQVIGGGLLHFAITCAVLVAPLHVFLGLGWDQALLLAIALGFSSTVLAAKVLEAKRELKAFHGRVAIGILIVQDLIAIAVLSIAGGSAPSPWALTLLALPLLRPVFHKVLEMSGHDELLLLTGALLALVVGGMGFEALGLSGELGALLIGVLLANHPRASELSRSLWSLKEFFLIGFFLQIGMSGLPDLSAVLFALALTLALPLKGVLFFFLLMAFKLRARNAFLAALSLTCYSEFGLIVAAGVLQEWLVPLAITVAFSFVFAAPANRFAHTIFERFEPFLNRFERRETHPDEQPASLGDARILVMGMGRTGTATYDMLSKRDPKIIGLDSDPTRIAQHVKEGRHAVYADAEDSCFWNGVDISGLEGVVLAMNDHEAKMIAARQLRRTGFKGPVVAHAMFEDEAEQAIAAGATQTYLTMVNTGIGLGERVWEAMSGGLGSEEPGPGSEPASRPARAPL